MTGIFICDTCGGPASWCLDATGDFWTLCKDDSCSSRIQVELFPEEPLWGERVDSSMRSGDTLDAGRSTSSSNEVEDLPF